MGDAAAGDAAARDLAHAFGAVNPEAGTLRAIGAVIDQLQRSRVVQLTLRKAAEDRACRSVHAAEEAEEERCWVCLEGEEGGPLVQLCACRGTNTWAHKHCVDEWRRTSPREDAAYRCGTCKDHYRDALSLELLSARLQAERANGGSTGFTLNTLAMELQA